MVIPLMLGLGILRYRLWEIDTIINKALVYGGLSLLLAAVYLGLIVGLESLLGLVSGQASQPVVIVVSTLVIAALFQPLRHRVQAIIDRRFYRHKYDAARTLAAFSAILQNEVDLSQLSEQLVTVVQETMQPASVSLWLRPSSRERTPAAHQLSPWNGAGGCWRGSAHRSRRARRCPSAFSRPATVYRAAQGQHARGRMAVLVQRMVMADAAGVAFTANPITGDRAETVISAVQGSGE